MHALLFIILLLIILILYILMRGAIKRYQQKIEIQDMIEMKRNFEKIDSLKKGFKE